MYKLIDVIHYLNRCMHLFISRATPSMQYETAQSAQETSKEIIEYVSLYLISFTSLLLFVQMVQNLHVLF